MGPEQGPGEADRNFKASETSSNPEESDNGRLEKINEVYSAESKMISRDLMFQDRGQQIENAIAGGKEDYPGTWQVLKGKTMTEAARILATELLSRVGTAAALEKTDLPVNEKAEILAQYYEAFAKAVKEHPGIYGMGQNEKANKEIIDESLSKASLLRGK